ncbi:unnamed protein product [Peniophora sp. CBMAI 1063]|nr:unnamed protein product [Peniophora sp. CBMAI 1063]
MSAVYGSLVHQDSDLDDSTPWPPTEFFADGGTAYPSPDSGKRDILVKDPSRLYRGFKNLCSLPMVLHVGVFALYIALCIIWITGVVPTIHVALTSASLVQTWLNLSNHLVMLTLSTAIAAVMQPLATRSPFGNLPQSLTSLSDKISSWSGLGSSLLNLYHNLTFPASLSNAIITSLYFTVLSGLGISSSFLFNVPATNETISHTMTTQIGSPSVEGFIPPGSGISGVPSDFTNLTFNWFRSGVGVGMLLGNNATTFSGISSNRIYDTLSPPMSASSNSTAIVGYTEFNVKCGSVPQASISTISDSQYDDSFIDYDPSNTSQVVMESRSATLLTINYTLGTSNITLSDVLSVADDSTSGNIISRLWQPADVLLRLPNSKTVPGIGRNIVLYNIYNETGRVSGSHPIVDYEGSTGLPWPVRVRMWPDGTTEAADLNTSLRIQVIGCSLSTSTGVATIDARTNQLLSPPASTEGSSPERRWMDWEPDLEKSNRLEDTWSTMFLPNVGSIGLWDSQPVSPDSLQWSCLDYRYQWETTLTEFTWNRTELQTKYESCHVPTVIEDYLTTRLFGAVTSHSAYGDTVRDSASADTTLRALESALADATAVAMWSGARANTLMVTYTPPPDTMPSLQQVTGTFVQVLSTIVAPVNGSASVIERVLVGRITFNVPSLVTGLILSAILTMMSAYLLVRGDMACARRAPISDAGLLSLMTLDNSVIAARLSALAMRSVQSRRRAGDFLVRVEEGRLVVVGDVEKDQSASLRL